MAVADALHAAAHSRLKLEKSISNAFTNGTEGAQRIVLNYSRCDEGAFDDSVTQPGDDVDNSPSGSE